MPGGEGGGGLVDDANRSIHQRLKHIKKKDQDLNIAPETRKKAEDIPGQSSTYTAARTSERQQHRATLAWGGSVARARRDPELRPNSPSVPIGGGGHGV